MTLNRRDFLKLSGAGLGGLLLSQWGLDSAQANSAPFEGRVVYLWTNLYDAPSFNANKIMALRRDTLLSVTDQVATTDGDAYNPVWYQVGDQGYIYSGWVQPVETVINEPVNVLLGKGATAEVTVPFTQIYWKPRFTAGRGEMLYYSTAHWVIGVEYNKDEQQTWYYIYDDRLKTAYYAQAQHLRILTPEDLAPISGDVPEAYKHIEVNLTAQRVTAYEDGLPVRVMKASTGTKYNPTPTGWFKTFYKRSSRRMLGGELEAPEYDLVGVPWVTYITDGGVSFHGTYWHNDYGTPHSHGCINLKPSDAKWLFRWTTPKVPNDERFVYLPGQGIDVHVF